MSTDDATTGSVVVLGVKGSGKTVFLSILGHTFERSGVFGLNLTGRLGTGTTDYVSDAYQRMYIDHEWPESTTEGTRAELSWTVRDGSRKLFTIDSLDCAGEEIVKALAPSMSDKAEKTRKSKDEAKAGESGAAWGDESTGDAIDEIRKRVAEASIVCLFVNPADFKQFIYADMDNIGGRDEVDAALDRSRDMMKLLQTFLENPQRGKRVIVTVTQTGRSKFAEALERLGDSKAYVCELAPSLGKWLEMGDARVISVSAVNDVVWKTKDGKVYRPDDAEIKSGMPAPGREKEGNPVERLVWEGLRDGNTHSAPKEYPEISEESPPTGLAEFLLAVGGPLSAELAPLDSALQTLRDRHYDLFCARHNSGLSEKDRLKEAERLKDALDDYSGTVARYMKDKSRRGAVAETNRHLDEETAKAIGWIMAERELDAELRAAAASSGQSNFAESVKAVVARTAEAVTLYASGRPHVLECYRPVTQEGLGIDIDWWRGQVGEYGRCRASAEGNFEAAVADGDADAAQAALDAFSNYGLTGEVDQMRAELDRCREHVRERDRRRDVIAHGRMLLDEASQALDEASLALSGSKGAMEESAFRYAREKRDEAVRLGNEAQGLLMPLRNASGQFGEAPKVDSLMCVLQERARWAASLLQQINEAEANYGISQELDKVETEIATARESLGNVRPLCNAAKYDETRNQVALAGNCLERAEAKLAGIGLPDDDTRIAEIRGRIDGWKKACDDALLDIENAVRKGRRKRQYAAGFAIGVILIFVAGGCLMQHSREVARRRNVWMEAKALAEKREYAGAIARMEAIGGVQKLLKPRNSLLDAQEKDLAYRISRGEEFRKLINDCEEFDNSVSNRLENLAKETGLEFPMESVDKWEELAPVEWTNLVDKAKMLDSLTDYGDVDNYGLPTAREAMDSFLESKWEINIAAGNVGTASIAYCVKARNAFNERKRRERVEFLSEGLKVATPPQGWKALAEALPQAGVGGWLDLTESEVESKWRLVMESGLPDGANPPVIDFAKAKASFDELRQKATTAEWEEYFAGIEDYCSKVLEARKAIDDELHRRRSLKKGLADIQKGIKDKAWILADMHYDTAKRLLREDRSVDANARKKLDEYKDQITEAQEIQEVAAAEKLADEGKLREAALKCQKMGNLSKPAAAKKMATLRQKIIRKIRDNVDSSVRAGRVKSEDFANGSRFCLDLDDFRKDAEAELDRAIDIVCPPGSPGNKFKPDNAVIGNVSKAIAQSHLPGISQKAKTMSTRMQDWSKIWLDDARAIAIEARNGKSAKDKWEKVIEAERLLGLVMQGGRDTAEGAKIREMLPPVLRVSLVGIDGTTPVDAREKARKQPKDRFFIAGKSKGISDMVATEKFGRSVNFSFKDEDFAGRAVQFSWHGSRHVRMRLGSPSVVEIARPAWQ